MVRPFFLFWILIILMYIGFLQTLNWLYFFLILILTAMFIFGIHQVDSYFSYINLFGKRFLYQSSKASLMNNCNEEMRNFCHTAKETLNKLPPGKYHTITHDTVIQRFQKFSGIEITDVKYVYSADLFREVNYMMGKRCQRCTQKSTCRFIRSERRSFYYVKFKKIK